MLTSCFHYTEMSRKIKHSRALCRIIWHERVMLMNELTIYIPENTPALRHAGQFLTEQGYAVTRELTPSVTHLLLSVPTGDSALIHELPSSVTVFGGNLPALEGRKAVDLLKDPIYLAQNAMITAHCALEIAAGKLPITWSGAPVLILGWGRIGKCLAQLLNALGACVTVAARKPADRAMLLALGYDAVDTELLAPELHRFRVIFNTAPHMVISDGDVVRCRPDCVKIDLSSAPGIGGSGVIWARGLPGKMAPESSGKLIAQTVLRLAEEV